MCHGLIEDMTMLLSPLTWSPVRDQVVVGNIPKQPPGFLPRPALQARLNQPDPVIVVTGKPGAGKTQLAAAYARARLEGGWRLVAWRSEERRVGEEGGSRGW